MNVIKLTRHKFADHEHCFYQELDENMLREGEAWTIWLGLNTPEAVEFPPEI